MIYKIINKLSKCVGTIKVVNITVSTIKHLLDIYESKTLSTNATRQVTVLCIFTRGIMELRKRNRIYRISETKINP